MKKTTLKQKVRHSKQHLTLHIPELSKGLRSSGNLLFFSVLMIIFSSITFADPEQYQMSGISRDGSFVQEGNSYWGSISPTTSSRTFTSIESGLPIVDDVDDDGTNEIIIHANGYLYLLHYSPTVGITIESSTRTESPTVQGAAFLVTPTTYSNGTQTFIATTNITQFYVYTYNGSDFTTIMNATTGINPAGTPLISSKYVNVKCAPGSQWSSGNTTCVFFANNRTGATSYQTSVACDVDAGICRAESSASIPNGNAETTWHDTHIADGDNDGALEAYISENDGTNGDLYIYKLEVNSTGNPTRTLLYTDLQTNGRPHTDITVNNLDGTLSDGMEITFGLSTDGTNYDAKTIRATDGSVVQASYCTLLTCPEGTAYSSNMIISDDTTYCDYAGDVYYYVRNPTQSDPGANIDTVYCVSLYAGAGYHETAVSSTTNFTANTPFMIHQMEISGSTGILNHKFMISEDTKATTTLSQSDAFIISVDYQVSGSLDLIGINATVLRYYDDGLTNSNYAINSFGSDTGSPACLDATITYNITVSDTEDDPGTCYLDIHYTNGTVVGNYSIQNFASSPSVVQFFYTASLTGSFYARAYCKDQYHADYVNRSRTFSVTNSTPCYNSGTGGSSTSFNTTSVPADTSLDDTMSTLFGASTKTKAIAGVGIIIGITVGVITAGGGAIGGLIAAVLGTILVTFLGLLSVYVLILIIIFLLLAFLIGKAIGLGSGG